MDVETLMVDLMALVEDEIMRVLGRPLVATLILWPSNAHELANYITNIEPARRGEVAQAMIELLTRWGYMTG
jgi:hypothetical protein